MKIARVSGAHVEIAERDHALEIRGGEKARRDAMKFIRCVMAQRVGPVYVDDADVEDECTSVHVPQDAIGFVTGKGGNFLRTIEDEHSVIMFFAVLRGQGGEGPHGTELLTIFGSRRSRRGAQLMVMRTVEAKSPGYYTEETKASNELYDKEYPGEDWGTQVMWLKAEEISYAYGKKGMTRKKVANASGCIIQYVGDTVFLTGSAVQRQRAQEYMNMLFEQLEGSVSLDTSGRTDCTQVEVPTDCIGYVTGIKRETLGRVEEEWGTLMFFVDRCNSKSDGNSETLVIFGKRRSRRGAELKVMSSVESKHPGYYTLNVRDTTSDSSGFDTDSMILEDEEEVAYALGREGATRRKLAAASHAILEYVGKVVFIAGSLKQRRRCRDYIGWLLDQRLRKVVVDTKGRDDVTEVQVPQNCVGRVAAGEMRRIEQESSTFCFMASDPQGDERLCIFGHDPGTKSSETGRALAERLFHELFKYQLQTGEGDAVGSRSRSPRRLPAPERGGRGDDSWRGDDRGRDHTYTDTWRWDDRRAADWRTADRPHWDDGYADGRRGGDKRWDDRHIEDRQADNRRWDDRRVDERQADDRRRDDRWADDRRYGDHRWDDRQYDRHPRDSHRGDDQHWDERGRDDRRHFDDHRAFDHRRGAEDQSYADRRSDDHRWDERRCGDERRCEAGSQRGAERRGGEHRRVDSYRADDRRSDDRQFDDRWVADRRADDRRADDRRLDDRRLDIRRPDDRRPDDRRLDDRRPDNRHLDGRRLDERRPDGRRPDDRRQADWRQDDRRPNERRPDDRRLDDRRPDDCRLDDRRLDDRRCLEDRRQDNRRLDDRRLDDRRLDGRRPEDRRPDDRRPADRRQDDRRPYDRRQDTRRDGHRPDGERSDHQRPEDRRPDERHLDDRRADGRYSTGWRGDERCSHGRPEANQHRHEKLVEHREAPAYIPARSRNPPQTVQTAGRSDRSPARRGRAPESVAAPRDRRR